MFLSFKIFVERRESNPSKTRLSRSLSTDALAGWVEAALVSRRDAVKINSKKIYELPFRRRGKQKKI